MADNHIQIADLPYCKPVKEWLNTRYGAEQGAFLWNFFGIEQIHGTLIRCDTCGNSEMCDYCVVGNKNPLADRYEIRTDEVGFLVSVEKDN